MKSPRSILVPVDLSNHSLIALLYAEEIAVMFRDAIITVVFVDEHRDVGSDVTLEAKAHSRITALMIEKGIAHTNVDICIQHGRPAPVIVRTAKERNIDLIVMSTHGRTGLGHVLMGSVAEKVVRYAPCPVLTVKPEEFREIVSLTEEDVAGSLHLQRES